MTPPSERRADPLWLPAFYLAKTPVHRAVSLWVLASGQPCLGTTLLSHGQQRRAASGSYSDHDTQAFTLSVSAQIGSVAKNGVAHQGPDVETCSSCTCCLT